MTPRATPKTPKATRVDWAAALGYWLNLAPTERTYAQVAREYRVTAHTVRKHAHAEGWLKTLADVDRRAREAIEKASVKTAKDRAIQTARIRDLTADAIERKLTVKEGEVPAIDDAVLARIFADVDRMTRLDDGAATDRVEVSEVQRTLADFVIRIGRFVAAEHRQEFLDVFRAFEQERRSLALDAGDPVAA